MPPFLAALSSRRWIWPLLLISAVLALMFARSFQHGKILFVNDTTFGQMKMAANDLPQAIEGKWYETTWVGTEGPASPVNLSTLLAWVFPPELFLKLYGPFSLLFFSFCLWVFLRQLQFRPAVCLIIALSAALNMHFFSIACWGLGQWNIAAGFIVLSFAVIESRAAIFPWIKAAAAGWAIGLGVIEGSDVGAMLSLYAGAFILWRWRGQGRWTKTIFVESLAVVFALLVATHTIHSMVETQVTDIVWGSSHDARGKDERWEPATQWSLPKMETASLFIPGIFGYTMADRIEGTDKSSSYWGTIGQDPRILDLQSDDMTVRANAAQLLLIPDNMRNALVSGDDATRQQALDALTRTSPNAWRFSGTGEYAGLIVTAFAIFALVKSGRSKSQFFTKDERTAIWFWGAVSLVSLLLAWGRFGPLYWLLYQLPFAETVRNPIKFLHAFHISWLILAAYGLEAFFKNYLSTVKSSARPRLYLAGILVFALPAAAFAGWYFYTLSGSKLVERLIHSGFNPGEAKAMAAFSAHHLLRFLFMMGGLALFGFHLVTNRRPRNTFSFIVVIGLVTLLDGARGNTPWIRYIDFHDTEKPDAVLDVLADHPFEHRVAGRLSPRGVGAALNSATGKQYFDWLQNEFPLRNIQTLDFAQWPRMPVLDANYLNNFALHAESNAITNLFPALRLWQLSNTRFLALSTEAATMVEHATSAATAKMPMGDAGVLLELTNALPRVKLYSSWQVLPDTATLDLLARPDFDPHTLVIVSEDTAIRTASNTSPSTNSDVASIVRYTPQEVVIHAKATATEVLLLNDRYSPKWHVTVDDQPARLRRCNYLMRGVELLPGEHIVRFQFFPERWPFYLTIAAMLLGGIAFVRVMRRSVIAQATIHGS